MAERLRKCIADHAFQIAEDHPLRVTASIGFVEYPLFRDGTVGRYFEHWITGLARDAFDVHVYALQSMPDVVDRVTTADGAVLCVTRAAATPLRQTTIGN